MSSRFAGFIIAGIAGIAALVATACVTPTENYTCSESSACVTAGQQGTCEPSGFCSFPDTACPSGQRYGDLASSELANGCVASMIACGNGVDDDNDGLVDSADPGCAGPGDDRPAEPVRARSLTAR